MTCPSFCPLPFSVLYFRFTVTDPVEISGINFNALVIAPVVVLLSVPHTLRAPFDDALLECVAVGM